MHALHSTLLPPSAIYHSLFLPNFTPSTIYPLPRPATTIDEPDVEVTGNLVVAGGEDLRIFEIREQLVPVHEREVNGVNGMNGDNEMVEEDFFDTGHAAVRSSGMSLTVWTDGKQRAPLRYETTRRLHLLTRHHLHGTVTGLANLRTMESSVDGLDRLLVSIKDAKVSQAVSSSVIDGASRWLYWSGLEATFRLFRCTRTSDVRR